MQADDLSEERSSQINSLQTQLCIPRHGRPLQYLFLSQRGGSFLPASNRFCYRHRSLWLQPAFGCLLACTQENDSEKQKAIFIIPYRLELGRFGLAFLLFVAVVLRCFSATSAGFSRAIAIKVALPRVEESFRFHTATEVINHKKDSLLSQVKKPLSPSLTWRNPFLGQHPLLPLLTQVPPNQCVTSSVQKLSILVARGFKWKAASNRKPRVSVPSCCLCVTLNNI